MLISEVVSLIAPCYNGEEYVERFIKSVLAQKYKKIQFIFVDDGSTDCTTDIIEKYLPILKRELLEVIFLRKENGGAASAVNDALKYVKGEYLAWADCDDILYPDNIGKKVDYLKKNSDKGLVLCAAETFEEETWKKITRLMLPLEEQKENIFEKLIFEGISCYAGVFMVRTDLLFKRLGKAREISFNKEVGQNWQLLLPVSYDNDCGYIQECLYGCVIRKNSHSRVREYESLIKRTYIQESILRDILSFVEEAERTELFDRIELKYIRQRMDFSFEQIDKKIFQENLVQFRMRVNEVPNEYVRKAFLIKFKPLVIMNRILVKVQRRIKRRVKM